LGSLLKTATHSPLALGIRKKLYFPIGNTFPSTFTSLSVSNVVASLAPARHTESYGTSVAYFKLKRQNEEILVQKSQAELNFLKAQVQPHFLFNTLNNIYFEAFKEAPRTAELIDRLSDIMRYFVDETPKDAIALSTEVSFIENYITLEKIRIRHGVDITFEKSFDSDLRIPPMLLMTFVENIFKHGINRSGIQNQIRISLVQQDRYLIFTTSNSIQPTTIKQQSNSFGIANLKKRLAMLYGSNFELTIDKNEKSFTALLQIPLT
jgi:LytS/YehU family sensor histidine kinase